MTSVARNLPSLTTIAGGKNYSSSGPSSERSEVIM
jgi:hypothetical protein